MVRQKKLGSSLAADPLGFERRLLVSTTAAAEFCAPAVLPSVLPPPPTAQLHKLSEPNARRERSVQQQQQKPTQYTSGGGEGQLRRRLVQTVTEG